MSTIIEASGTKLAADFSAATNYASRVTIKTLTMPANGFGLLWTLDQPMILVVDGVDQYAYVPSIGEAGVTAGTRVFDFSPRAGLDFSRGGWALPVGTKIEAYAATASLPAAGKIVIDGLA